MRNLIADLDYFTEQLADARAESRADAERNKDAAKKSILASTGRTQPEKPAQSVAQVMEQRAKLSEMLKQWKASNPL